MSTTPCPWTRREFLRGAGSCAAHMGLMSATAAWLPRSLWAAQERFPVVARESWGRLERVAEGVWALVSTPLEGDRTTLCNGGIVAGRAGVLVVEAFGSDAGSEWMAAQARALAGRMPTHVVLTHYHSDHTGGVRGAMRTADVTLLATTVTRDQVEERNQDPPKEILDGATLLDGHRPTEIDLGDRSVLVVPRRGHTDSDVSLELSDPSVVFCGDLVWNRMFPNYVDAVPTRLTANVRLLRTLGASTYVPGHGPLADPSDLERYQALLDDVEAAARRAMEGGTSAEDAGAAYRIPASLGEWTLFNPAYFSRAIGAWMRELGA
jgi:glyoxylase-like metal-dependent hydrolase (beta-lactamase superfamily II)